MSQGTASEDANSASDYCGDGDSSLNGYHYPSSVGKTFVQRDDVVDGAEQDKSIVEVSEDIQGVLSQMESLNAQFTAKLPSAMTNPVAMRCMSVSHLGRGVYVTTSVTEMDKSKDNPSNRREDTAESKLPTASTTKERRHHQVQQQFPILQDLKAASQMNPSDSQNLWL